MSKYEEELPQTLAYFIHNKVRWRIIVGDLTPGQPLREAELQSQYGSSRGPVRESLRLLLQTGLVENEQRKGFRVRSYNEKSIQDIYHLRVSLELAILDSLRGLDLEDLCTELSLRVQLLESKWKKKDIDGYFLENIEYHRVIVEYTDNQPLIHVVAYVNEISYPIRYRIIADSFPTRRSLDYHYDLLTHLKDGEIDSARSLTEKNIIGGEIGQKNQRSTFQLISSS